ncbi:MAG TPA: hypothetical protein VF711_04850 [Acidimicrobiales bacterium]
MAKSRLVSKRSADESPLLATEELVGFLRRPVPAPFLDIPQLLRVVDPDAIDAFADVARLLAQRESDERHKATSLRLNESLREAAEIVVRHGWAPSFTALVEESVATTLAGMVATVAEQAALDEHYAEHPEARPDLWEIAVAAAKVDGSPLAEQPDVIRRAAEALGPKADIDTVLIWAAGALAGASVE